MEKVALVTGASRGIGRAIAILLAQRGYAVCVNYARAQTQAIEVVTEIQANGGKAMAVQADVSCKAEVDAMVGQVEQSLGTVDLLVNNAAVSLEGLFQDTLDEQWERIFAVNVGGVRNTISRVLPPMLHCKQGCIINVSSIWGQRGASCEVAYAATKAAVEGLSRSLALELAPSGIRVNCVAPGCIETDMLQALGQDTLAELAQETPVGRLGKPSEIARVVGFLASEDASFLTGQVLTADGGFCV